MKGSLLVTFPWFHSKLESLVSKNSKWKQLPFLWWSENILIGQVPQVPLTAPPPPHWIGSLVCSTFSGNHVLLALMIYSFLWVNTEWAHKDEVWIWSRPRNGFDCVPKLTFAVDTYCSIHSSFALYHLRSLKLSLHLPKSNVRVNFIFRLKATLLDRAAGDRTLPLMSTFSLATFAASQLSKEKLLS